MPFGASRCLFGALGISFPIQGLFWRLKTMPLFDFFTVVRAVRNETRTISIYPGLEGLGFRV